MPRGLLTPITLLFRDLEGQSKHERRRRAIPSSLSVA